MTAEAAFTGSKDTGAGGPNPGAGVGATDGANPTRFTSIALKVRDLLAREYPRQRNLLGDGLFCAGDFGILFGVPGGGKTFAALQLALALARGDSWFGLRTGDGGPATVGFLELELTGNRLQARLRAIAGEAGFDERDDALQLVCRPDLKGRVDALDPVDMAALTEWCRTARLDLLIVDALNRVHTVNENQSFEMSPVLAAFDQLRFGTGTAVLLLHHEPKPSAGGRAVADLDALRGTTRLRDDPNVLIRLIKRQGALRTLHFPKANNADDQEEIWLYKTASGVLEVTEPPGRVSDRSRERIHTALIEGAPSGLTNEEIQRRVGLKRAAVSKHLAVLAAVEIPGKPPRYLPPSTPSRTKEAEAGSRLSINDLAAPAEQLPVLPAEHLPPSTPSTLKGGKARGRSVDLVPDGSLAGVRP